MTILNMLPLQGDEQERFEALAPEAVHIYAGRRSVPCGEGSGALWSAVTPHCSLWPWPWW